MTFSFEVHIAFDGTTTARGRRTKTKTRSRQGRTQNADARMAAYTGGKLWRAVNWLLWIWFSMLPHIITLLR